MVRAQLWPAAPKRPQIAFTFELMDWVEALLLECQVSLKDFCKALCFKCPHLVNKVHINEGNLHNVYRFNYVTEKGILLCNDRLC